MEATNSTVENEERAKSPMKESRKVVRLVLLLATLVCLAAIYAPGLGEYIPGAEIYLVGLAMTKAFVAAIYLILE